MEISQREKILIAFMLLLGIVFLSSLILQKVEEQQQSLEKRTDLQQSQFKNAQKLEREWIQVNQVRPLATISRSLTSYMESMARDFNLQQQLQLNAINSVNLEGIEGVEIRLNPLNLDQMFDIIYFLENNRPVLLVKELEINSIPGSQLLRMTFQVFKQNNS